MSGAMLFDERKSPPKGNVVIDRSVNFCYFLWRQRLMLWVMSHDTSLIFQLQSLKHPPSRPLSPHSRWRSSSTGTTRAASTFFPRKSCGPMLSREKTMCCWNSWVQLFVMSTICINVQQYVECAVLIACLFPLRPVVSFTYSVLLTSFSEVSLAAPSCFRYSFFCIGTTDQRLMSRPFIYW